MENLVQGIYTGERALFKSVDLNITDSIFEDGESPLKESKGIQLNNCIFKWKYPLWYCNDIKVNDSTLLETARSGIWYTHHIQIKNSIIEAPKTFRRSSHIELENVDMLLNRTLYQRKIKKNCKIKKPMDGALCRIQLHNVPSFIWLYRSYGL